MLSWVVLVNLSTSAAVKPSVLMGGKTRRGQLVSYRAKETSHAHTFELDHARVKPHIPR
jgi:hypothetical protein